MQLSCLQPLRTFKEGYLQLTSNLTKCSLQFTCCQTACHVLQWEHARAKISQAEQEARHVEYKMREAADLARRSNEARSEAEQAMQLEQETRSAAKDLPGRTRAYLYDTRCTITYYPYCIFQHCLCAAT